MNLLGYGPDSTLTIETSACKIRDLRREQGMGNYLASAWLAFVLAVFASAQQPPDQKQAHQGKSARDAPSQPDLKTAFESKVKAEWEAVKNKDKKALGDLLADDFEGVEVDGQGERTRTQSMSELANGNVQNYTLWGFRVTPVGPDATFVIYEVTIQFPPKSAVRYSRVYVSELWVKRNGQWKELHYQETHVK